MVSSFFIISVFARFNSCLVLLSSSSLFGIGLLLKLHWSGKYLSDSTSLACSR